MTKNLRQSIDFYDSEAEVYDQRRWSTTAGSYMDKMQKAKTLSLIGDCSGKKALDIATGTGRFALELARNGAFVTTLDSSRKMLDIVRRKFEKEGLLDKLTTIHGTAIDLPFSSENFDICVCINALNHIPEHKTVLREIGRVLVPNGISVTNYTNWLSCYMPIGIWVNLRRKSLTRDVYTKWFSPFEIIKLNELNGLIIRQILGAVQFPSKITNKALLCLFKALNQIPCFSLLKWVAPQIFVKSQKTYKCSW
jgi:ubiquinone/menaquinone biosynthesis C-methylase UbiE